MGIDPFGHEIDQDRPNLLIENKRPPVLVQDLQPEADRPLQLAADRRVAGKIQGQEFLVDHGKLGGDIEIGRVVVVPQQGFQTGIKTGRVKMQAV